MIPRGPLSETRAHGRAIEMKALVTGGAGFVGSNYASHLLSEGWEVVIFDNLGRGKGCENNLQWLRTHANSKNLRVLKGEVSSSRPLQEAMKGCDMVLHAAAQVSVPQSIAEPLIDFESNVLGTYNVLEAARKAKSNPTVLYTSSNKVYGIPDSPLRELDTRYDFKHLPSGVDEYFPLKGEEPYGASKATGDLYLHAYSMQYDLKAVSFRCSCMYGPRQWGKEEQGWVAWFCIAAALNKPINIYGDGKQVRDLLYIDDVTNAFDLALEKINTASGEAINLGGGSENVVSLLETIAYIESLTNRKIRLRFKNWRPGDNKCYYTDYGKAEKLLGWTPKVAWKEGVKKTLEWVQNNLPQISAAIRRS